MSQHTCKKCGATKSPAEMLTRNGKIFETCKACYQTAIAAGRKSSGGGKVIAKPKAAKVAKASEESTPTLTIEAGHGLVAVIHDGYLQIQQTDEDDHADTLMLLKSEARALFHEFDSWAND